MAAVISTVTDPLAAAISALLPQFEPLVTALSSLNNQINQTLSTFQSFAGALSPATVNIFNQAIQNLDATVGQAAVPVFQSLVGIVNTFSGILSPLAAELGPIFQELTTSVAEPLLNMTRVIVEAFRSLLPAFDAIRPSIAALTGLFDSLVETVVNIVAQAVPILAVAQSLATVFFDLLRFSQDLINIALTPLTFVFQALSLVLLPLTAVMDALNTAMDGFHEITRATEIIFRSLYEALKEVVIAALAPFANGLKSAAEQIRAAFISAAQQILIFSARVAAAFGAFGFIDKLIANLDKEGKERGLLAAPQNVQVKDFAAIARDMVQASFAAGPGGEKEKTEKQLLADIIPILKDIKNNPQTIQQVVKDGVQAIIDEIKKLKPEVFKPGAGGGAVAALAGGLAGLRR